MINFSDEQIEFMRQDIQSGFALSNLIELAKKKFKEQGKDFDKEFNAWKEQKKRG